MSRRFQRREANWVEYLKLPNLLQIDFHDGERAPDKYYWDLLREWEVRVAEALQQARREGHEYILFTHGSSTSRPGASTARSVVRGFMRSKAATPYIDRPRSIQQETVFLAVMRRANLTKD